MKTHHRRPLSAAIALAASLVMVGCGENATAGPVNTPAAAPLNVQLQNSRLLVGVNRISVALFTGKDAPVQGASANAAIIGADGKVSAPRPLEFIGPRYGNIPVYVGSARFAAKGSYTVTVRATLANGTVASGRSSVITITDQSPELPVGFAAPTTVSQRLLGDVHGDVSRLDSGVPPDPFHDHTIAAGLAAHHPMVLYFGQPGHCISETCGPTIGIVKDFAKTYSDRFWIEHIEVHDPADSRAFNPAYLAFGLSSEPWIYVVNAAGVVSDRFEGPVTTGELAQAADGTLAGHVPAVDVSAG